MLSAEEERLLTAIATRCRERIIRMSALGGCFVGGSLSCVDIILYLYKKYLNIGPSNINSPDRDYFFLSKGHDVPALYSVLAEMDIIDELLLDKHVVQGHNVYWHPSTSIPGVEFHSGSLGHSVSVAIGVAYHLKRNGLPNKVVVMVGDGELNEGSIWESLLVGYAKSLDNLLMIIDRNGIQANVRTEDLIPLESLQDKIRSFGWGTIKIDGHNFSEIAKALKDSECSDLPNAIISETVRGKGIPSIEGDPTKWLMSTSKKEVEQLVSELLKTTLESHDAGGLKSE